MEGVGSHEYFQILFDEEPKLLFEEIISTDALGFVDLKPYSKRLDEARKKSGYSDAISVGHGTIEGQGVVIACMNFPFIRGLWEPW